MEESNENATSTQVDDPRWEEGAPEESATAASEADKDDYLRQRAEEEDRAGREAGETHNQEIGRRGEEAAARYLKKRGYDILERNWTCAAGEADIIAKDEMTLVFVEVKTRTNVDHGLPEEAVDEKKRNRYERIAATYLQDYRGADMPIRFDVVSLLVVAPDRAMVKHHINAFG